MSEETPDSKEPKRGCFGLLWRSVFYFVTLIVLGYQFENWRGARAWEVQRERIEKLGVKPWGEREAVPLPPEENNFCAIPELVGIGREEDEGIDGRGRRFGSIKASSWLWLPENRKRRYEDPLVVPGFGFSEGNRWEESIKRHIEFGEKTGWLSLTEGSLVERLEEQFGDTYRLLINAAKERSEAVSLPVSDQYLENRPNRWIRDVNEPLLTSIGSGMGILAYGKIEVGDGNGALDAIRVTFRAVKALMADGGGWTRTHQGRYMFLGITSVIQAGIGADVFDDEQLAELAREVSATDIENASLAAIDREVVGYHHLLAVLSEGGWPYPEFGLRGINGNTGTKASSQILYMPTWVATVVPRGWADQVRAAHARNALDYGWLASKKKGRGAWAMWRLYSSYRSECGSGATWFPKPEMYLGPSEFYAAGHTVETMGRRDLALIAIALERYRLALGSFPASLEELVPKYLESKTIFDRATNASYFYSAEKDSYEITADRIFRRKEIVWRR